MNTAWFNQSPRPGESGNAIITGHYGYWKNGKSTVFNNLNKLRKGDKIYVVDEKGVVVNFVVREIRNYNPDAVASDVFFSNDNKSHLNLITCEGVWNKVSKSYSQRLVVFADKE
jgi:LPXTG-site transpeptidase (sortase) family protein